MRGQQECTLATREGVLEQSNGKQWMNTCKNKNKSHKLNTIQQKKERKRPLLNEDRSLVSVVNYQEIIKLGEARLHQKTSGMCHQELYLLFSCPLHICPPKTISKSGF